jgi:hypothetical protein
MGMSSWYEAATERLREADEPSAARIAQIKAEQRAESKAARRKDEGKAAQLKAEKPETTWVEFETKDKNGRPITMRASEHGPLGPLDRSRWAPLQKAMDKLDDVLGDD